MTSHVPHLTRCTSPSNDLTCSNEASETDILILGLREGLGLLDQDEIVQGPAFIHRGCEVDFIPVKATGAHEM